MEDFAGLVLIPFVVLLVIELSRPCNNSSPSNVTELYKRARIQTQI